MPETINVTVSSLAALVKLC